MLWANLLFTDLIMISHLNFFRNLLITMNVHIIKLETLKEKFTTNSKDYLLREDIADCIAAIRMKSDHLNAKNLIIIH